MEWVALRAAVVARYMDCAPAVPRPKKPRTKGGSAGGGGAGDGDGDCDGDGDITLDYTVVGTSQASFVAASSR